MAAKPASKSRRTITVPVTTMEEVPVLSPKERAALIASLEQAEARASGGKAEDLDPQVFNARLVGIHRKAKRSKRV
jgi:hypothetical protein